LGRAVSTVSDELNRNAVKSAYDPQKAQHKAYARRKQSKHQGMKIVAHPALRSFVESKLLEGRSPASIAGRVTNHEPRLPAISADSIERFLKSPYGRQIEAARKRLKAKRRYRKRRAVAARLTERTFIDERPAAITNRERVGDVEADFILSGKQGRGILLTIADRKLRVGFIEHILPVSIANVHAAFARVKARFPEMLTISTDNDILLAKHQALARELDVTIYFCHPYHSWEKGTIENTNGVIRQDIPKGSDISLYPPETIAAIEARLNGRYLACLGYATPQEALEAYRKQATRRACLEILKRRADARLNGKTG
jgi:IS30 family transposase